MRGVMITQTEGRSSQHLEFYHPDGIREIRMRLANFARMVIRVIREIRVLKKNKEKFYRTPIIENLLNADAQDSEGVSA